MDDSEQLLLLLAVAAAGFFVGLGYGKRTAAAASSDLGYGPIADPTMNWLVNWGGGLR